jgi:hypothetical protein
MNKIPRGYTITPKVKFLRKKDGKTRTNIVELINKKKGIKKFFINEDFALKFISTIESQKVEANALAGKGAPTAGKAGIISAGKDLIASKELDGDFSHIDNENE